MAAGLRHWKGGLLLVALALHATSGLRAQITAHAPFAPFAVTIQAGSTIFNQTIGFNGSRADLGGSFSLNGVEGGGYQNLSGTVVLLFQSDPGYVFSGLNLSYGQWSFSNAPSFGGFSTSGGWSVPGGNYVGSINPAENSGAVWDSWQGSGSSGSWYYQDFTWWSGGGNTSMALMGPNGSYNIELSSLTSFTLTVNAGITVASNSGFGTSNFSVDTQLVAIPEPASTAAVTSALALGAAAWWRRGRRSAGIAH